MFGKLEQMEYFIKSNPEIAKSVDLRNFNALHLSTRYGTLEGTECLVENHGFDILDSSNVIGQNSFLLAATVGKPDHMQFFIEKNPDVLISRSDDHANCNALHCSAFYGTLEGTEFLVEKHGFDIADKSNNFDKDALMLARTMYEPSGRDRLQSDQIRYLESKLA